MEINFNNSANKGFAVGSLAPETAGGVRSAETGPSRLFTITESTASPDDIAAAGIPDAALSRDDALGKLIGEAFDLPPPPMPNFAANP